MKCSRKIVHHAALQDDTAACLEKICGVQLERYTETKDKERTGDDVIKVVAR